MKHILFLLLFLPVLAYAQFPANPNKIRLGNQTTADGLVVRTAASPSWTPSSINNAWLAFDTVAVKLYYYDGGAWQEYTGGTDTNFATDNLTFSGNRVHNLSTRTLTIADGGTYPTFQQSAATDGFTIASSATDVIALTPGLLQIESSDTITITADRIRMNAADTRIQQVAKDNALNRLAAIDSLTGRLYYVDKSSIAGGSGTVTGTGTTGTIPVWSGSSALGDSPLTVSSGSVTATGTGFFLPPVGTTAQRPGTPSAGMTRYNTTNGALEYYAAFGWEIPLKSAAGTGLGSTGRVFYANSNQRAAADDLLVWDATNDRLGIGTTGPAYAIDVTTSNNVIGRFASSATDYAQFLMKSGGNMFMIPQSGAAKKAGFVFSNSTTLKWAVLNDGTDSDKLKFNYPDQGGTNYFTMLTDGKMGLGTSTPSQTLHVIGTARITGSDGTGTAIMLRDADGDISNATLGTGLSLTSGTLASTVTDTHLGNANLTLTGARSHDLAGNNLQISGTASNVSTALQLYPGTAANLISTNTSTLFQSSISVKPASADIVAVDVLGAKTTELKVLSDRVTTTPAAITKDNALTRLMALDSVSGRWYYIDKSSITGATDLTFSGSSSPFTLASSTGTDVTIAAGDRISLSRSGNELTIGQSIPAYAQLALSGTDVITFASGSTDPDSVTALSLTDVGSQFALYSGALHYVGTGGYFLINYSASWSFTEASVDITSHLWKNGSLETGTYATHTTLLGGEKINTSGHRVIYLATNDVLRFGYTPTAHTGDDDLTTHSLSITITRI